MSVSERDALYHLSHAIQAASEAWHKATTTNASHVQNVLNALTTLSASANPIQATPPPGALKEIHDTAAESLSRLQTTIKRLHRIITGIDRWLPEVDSQPKIHERACRFTDGLRADVLTKSSVIDKLLRTIDCVEVLQTGEAAVMLARWTEQTARTGAPDCDAAFLVALIDATNILQDSGVGQLERIMPGTPKDARAGDASTGSVSPVSPALAMLKRRSAG